MYNFRYIYGATNRDKGNEKMISTYWNGQLQTSWTSNLTIRIVYRHNSRVAFSGFRRKHVGIYLKENISSLVSVMVQ